MNNLLVFTCPIRNEALHTGPLAREAKQEIMSAAGTTANPFQRTSVTWTQSDLDRTFNGPYVTTPHEMKDGLRAKDGFIQTHYILIDMDNGTPIKQFKDYLDQHRFRLLYYINYSANSLVEMPKYHVVVPLSRPVVGDEHALLVTWMTKEFGPLKPDMSVLKDRARGILRGNPDFPGIVGGQAVLDTDLILLEARAYQAKAVATAIPTPGASQAFRLTADLQVQLEDELGDWVALKNLDPATKPRILCPVCGHREDLRSGNNGDLTQNATYTTNRQGIPIIYCSSCDSRGWGRGGIYNFAADDPLVTNHLLNHADYADFFFLGNHLCKVFTQGHRVSVDKVPDRAIDIDDPEARSAFLTMLAKQTRSTEVFRVNHVGDPTASRVSYTWKDAVIEARYPLTKVLANDNAGVDAYLDFLFSVHANAIRDWLAVFVHTNLQPKLPAILLNGPQGTGKTTFAELVMNTYPGLGEIRGSKGEEYTSEYACKCMLIDENTKNKKSDLYTEIKELTGNKSLGVNTKYGLKYRVDNNLNVIVTTNAEKILHFEAGEEPTNPSNNRFLVLKLERPMPAALLQRAQDGWGHYCRTVLRDRWEVGLKDDVARRRHRFGIACPITNELKRQFTLSVTRLDHECEAVADAIVYGYEDYLRTQPVKTNQDKKGLEYLGAKDFRLLCQALILKNEPSAILQRMDQKGWMDSKVKREGGKGNMLGYLVHRDVMKQDLEG